MDPYFSLIPCDHPSYRFCSVLSRFKSPRSLAGDICSDLCRLSSLSEKANYPELTKVLSCVQVNLAG